MRLEQLNIDMHCLIFGFLAPRDVAGARSCSHELYESLDKGSVWAAAARHTSLPQEFIKIPTAKGAIRFNSIYKVNLSKDDAENALRVACRQGWLSKARWVTANRRIRRSFVWGPEDGPFEWACYGGHLPIMRWLVAAFGPRIQAYTDRYRIDALCRVGGNLEALSWYVRTLGVVDDPRWMIQRVFRRVCGDGHLAIAQWIVAHGETIGTGIGSGTVLAALRAASVSRHLPVVKWLMSHYTLTWDDVAVLPQCAALRIECEALQ